MVIPNSTNFNKTNNQFSTQLIQHKTNITTYDVRNPGPGLGQTYTCGGFIAYFALGDIRTHNFTVDRH